eukprot:2335355-Rhodomonas_salina.1
MPGVLGPTVEAGVVLDAPALDLRGHLRNGLVGAHGVVTFHCSEDWRSCRGTRGPVWRGLLCSIPVITHGSK